MSYASLSAATGNLPGYLTICHFYKWCSFIWGFCIGFYVFATIFFPVLDNWDFR
jgi:hypothetical protein